MSNELWNLHCTRTKDEESDFDTVTEWAANYIVHLETQLAALKQQVKELEQSLAKVCREANRAERELAALKIDNGLTIAYMSGFRDGKKAAQQSRSDAGLGADGLLHDRCHKELHGARPAKTAVAHVTPAIDETCDHNWEEGADGNPERCSKVPNA